MSKSFHNILVATSLEPASDAVVITAKTVAEATGARLHLVHAFALPVAYLAVPTGMSVIDPEMLDTARDAERQFLLEQLSRTGVDTKSVATTMIEPGAAHRIIRQAAEDVEADLIIVGASGSDVLTQTLGSTADRVLRHATCPVLVVRPGLSVPPKRALATTDLSPLAEGCIGRGLAWLRAVGGGATRVDVLFVLSAAERDGSSQFTPEQIDRLAAEQLDETIDRLRTVDAGPSLEPRVRVGMPRHEILAELGESDDPPVELVILGTHGRSGFERFLLGSVAADVTDAAAVSVLVIPPDESS
ncbi:MAG: universal stress protein [Acidobacteriota bacterium]